MIVDGPRRPVYLCIGEAVAMGFAAAVVFISEVLAETPAFFLQR